MDEFSGQLDAALEIRRRRRIMMGKGEARPGAKTPPVPGAPPPPPLGPGGEIEFVGITRSRALATRAVAVPRGAALVFLAFRLVAGLLWLVHAAVKNPFNHWGFFPEWVDKFAKNSPIPPYKWWLENVVAPHIDFWGWVQFLTEGLLGVLLLLGLFTAAAGLLATAWAANIFIGDVFVPGEWVWGLLAFLLMMPLCWATRAGRYLGADAVLRPEWLASGNAWKRLLAKWAM